MNSLSECKKEYKNWYAFSKWFINSDQTFKYKGYEFMQKLRKFARYYPEVTLVSCDDIMATSSILAFIPYHTEKGIVMVFAPQHAEPSLVFLGDHNMKNVVNVLSGKRKI